MIASEVSAGTLFQFPVNTVGDGPQSVAVADLDGDAIPDLVAASGTSNDVSVLLGNGGGSFRLATAYGAGDAPQSVAVADLDGDTIPDLVTANLGSDDVSVLLGNGDGTFRAANAYFAGDRPLSIAVADLDGDTIPDVITANSYSDDVRVLLNLGEVPELLWRFFGTAEGGTIDVVLSGVALQVATIAGQSAAQVAQAIADAINGDPPLLLSKFQPLFPARMFSATEMFLRR